MDYFRKFYDQEKGAAWPKAPGKVNADFLAVLTPHIDFRVSTTAYSFAYEDWFSAPVADTYVVLGVGHRSHREWSSDLRDLVTPFGRAECDSEGALELQEEMDYGLLSDEKAHDGEHSIEFPVVLLQALRKLRGIEKPFRFLPILCGGMFDTLRRGGLSALDGALFELAAALKLLLAKHGDRAQLIISIDGCHIGPRFGHKYRVNEKVLALCEAWENGLWDRFASGNLEAFLTYVAEDQNARYFDGVGALSLVLALWGENFQLVKRDTSQWFEPGDASAVSFTSGSLFRKQARPL